MDLLDEHLTTLSLDIKLNVAIRASLGLAKTTLNRYYMKSDDSELYRITMGTCLVHATFYSLTIHSSTSAAQTNILQKSKLGTGMDRDCRTHCAR